MKNYKVKALKNFKDKVEQVERTKNDEFECTKERYEYLKENKAAELINIIEEEKKESIDELQVDPYKDFEVKKEKPKAKKTTKKANKK